MVKAAIKVAKADMPRAIHNALVARLKPIPGLKTSEVVKPQDTGTFMIDTDTV